MHGNPPPPPLPSRNIGEYLVQLSIVLPNALIHECVNFINKDISCLIRLYFQLPNFESFFCWPKYFFYFYLLSSIVFVLVFASQLNDIPQYLLGQLKRHYWIGLISQLLSKLFQEWH